MCQRRPCLSSPTPRTAARGRLTAIRKWHKELVSASEMGRRLGVAKSTVQSALRRMKLGSQGGHATQGTLALPEMATAAPDISDEVDQRDDPAPCAVVDAAITLDTDPADRSVDRSLAAMGLLQDAAHGFAEEAALLV